MLYDGGTRLAEGSTSTAMMDASSRMSPQVMAGRKILPLSSYMAVTGLCQ